LIQTFKTLTTIRRVSPYVRRLHERGTEIISTGGL